MQRRITYFIFSKRHFKSSELTDGMVYKKKRLLSQKAFTNLYFLKPAIEEQICYHYNSRSLTCLLLH